MRIDKADDVMNVKKIILMFCALVIPLIGAVLLLHKYGLSFQDVYIINTPWNDELSYYKQIEGMITYGHPKGYFGYNESTALLGTNGPWSPILMLPYVLIFKIVGLGTQQLLYANIILAGLTLAWLVKIFNLNIRQVIGIALFWIGFVNVDRYIFSIAPEFIVTLSVIWLFSSIFKYYISTQKRYLFLFWIILFLLTLARGYYAIYGLVAIVALFKKGKRHIVTTIIVMVAAVIGYLLLVHYLCAQYFNNLIDGGLISILFSEPATFMSEFSKIIGNGFTEMVNYIKEAKLEGGCVGVFYLVSIMAIVLTLLVGLIERQKCLAVSSLCFIGIILSIWIFYDVRTGSRHLIASAIALLLISVVVHEKIIIEPLFLIVSMGIAFGAWQWNTDGDIRPPENNQSLYELVNNPSIEIPIMENAWDNTVIWTLSCNYQDLFVLPPGIGLNICTDNYILENDRVNSKYVAIASDREDLNSRANEQGWNVIGVVGGTVFYSTR